MTLPTISVRVAFATDPTAATTWTDLTNIYAETFASRRGRNFEWDRVQTGEATVVFKNQDRRFDPTNIAGSYYPNVLPMRRLNVRATYSGTTYDVFTGYVRGWPQTWEANGLAAKVPVGVVDGMHPLALKKLNTTYGIQTSGARIVSVLTDAMWTTGQAWALDHATFSLLGTSTTLAPVGDQSIDLGQSSIQASTLVNVPALQHIQTVEETENGLFFMGKDGAATFFQRSRRLVPPYNVSVATFGDSTGELPYNDLEMDYSDDKIENEVVLQRIGGSVVSVSDATSKTRYFPHTYSNTQLLNTVDTEVTDAANFRLNRRKAPALRVAQMTIMPDRSPALLWPQVLGREIGDRITVKRRPPGGGAVITQESYIEGIAHDVRPGIWRTIFSLSPADLTTYWILNDPAASFLESTTRLSY